VVLATLKKICRAGTFWAITVRAKGAQMRYADFFETDFTGRKDFVAWYSTTDNGKGSNFVSMANQ
jgi:hypothetical protein